MSAESIAISSDRVVRFTSRAALLAALAAAPRGLTHAASAADEKPVASTASGNGKLRVEILSLKRIEADLVTLRWQIVNDDDKDFSMTPGNARLVDLGGAARVFARSDQQRLPRRRRQTHDVLGHLRGTAAGDEDNGGEVLREPRDGDGRARD